ncbi:dTDP-4-dehydrorhamnose 3,5-epimerase [bacterium]|nr:dTDP-4-dehydrorhamnose 3,5-epimerase [bacterium]
MPFIFEETHIEGVKLIKPKSFKDSRGYFFETYKLSEFVKNGIEQLFVQDNQSFSTKNVIRGIHFQNHPKPQGKLVRCVKGRIFDVAVDLDPKSETYKNWVGFELSENNKHMLYIPEGFGHGFSVLSDEAEIAYKCTNEYDSSLDSGIRFDDPELDIKWHIEVPVISEKDQKLPFLKNLKI